MRRVEIFDSTLRDGMQGGGVTFSIEDKLAVVELLDSLGVGYIEAGNPGSNPKDMEFFQRAKKLFLRHAQLVAFGSTRRKDISVEEDGNLQSILAAGTKTCVVFGKCWKFHVDYVLETTVEENFRMIEESCRYLKEQGKSVFFDAEHFFDGYQEDRKFAMGAIDSAIAGGAERICLCDTRGGIFPADAKRIVRETIEHCPVPVAVHFHDDCGMAVANSICAVEAGAVQVQGTLLGFGERCGNTNLSTVIPNLQLKLGLSCIPQEKIKKLTYAAKKLAAIANRDFSENLPYVGGNAFSHKAGMHADGVLKAPRSFEHIDPFLLGNHRRFPASEMSGRAVVLEKIKHICPEVAVDSQEVCRVLEEIKELERNGYQFEGADASFELLVRKRLAPFTPFFQLLHYHINTDFAEEEGKGASALVELSVQNQVQLMTAEGNGPVNALDQALRKALCIFYPVLSEVKLVDYKVRVLDGKNATASSVRVLITSSLGVHSYTTVGVSNDVVAASWKALRDSLEYLLLNGRANLSRAGGEDSFCLEEYGEDRRNNPRGSGICGAGLDS